VVVDVDAFALQNAFETNYGFEAGRVVVLLNAGASAININVVQGDQSVFTRDVSVGGNAYTEAVQKELGLSFDAAEQLKRGVPVDGATVEDAQPVLRAVTENVVLEIQKTLEFFKATASVDHIDQVVLSGGAPDEGPRELLRTPARLVSISTCSRKWRIPLLGGVDPALWQTTAPSPSASRSTGRGPMIRINLLGVERAKAKTAAMFNITARAAGAWR
jgi:hypothetical protein